MPTTEEVKQLKKYGWWNPGGVGSTYLGLIVRDLIKNTKPIKAWQKKLYEGYLKKLQTEGPPKKPSIKIDVSPTKYPLKVWQSIRKT